MISLQAPGSAVATDLTTNAAVALDCRTIMATGGGGTANVVFGKAAACQFQQAANGTTATLRPRVGTYLMQVLNAKVSCTFAGSAVMPSVNFCGAGTISPTGVTQVAVTCSTDPSFAVTVYAGNLTVADPQTSGALVVRGQSLSYSSTPTTFPVTTSVTTCPTCVPTSTTTPPPSTVPQALMSVFATQARLLGIPNPSAG